MIFLKSLIYHPANAASATRARAKAFRFGWENNSFRGLRRLLALAVAGRGWEFETVVMGGFLYDFG